MNFLGQNLWQHRGGSRFENWPKRDYLSVESEQAITDTGKIQQLFDQLCLNLCVALNNVYAMRPGTLISAPVFDQSGPADDRVSRRPQFVRDQREAHVSLQIGFQLPCLTAGGQTSVHRLPSLCIATKRILTPLLRISVWSELETELAQSRMVIGTTPERPVIFAI